MPHHVVDILVFLDAIDLVNQILHVLEAAPFLFLAIVLDRLVEYVHQLHLVNLMQHLRFEPRLALGNGVASIQGVKPLKRCLVLRDAVPRFDSTWQGLLAHELRRGRVSLVSLHAAQVRHVRSVYVAFALHVGYICRGR